MTQSQQNIIDSTVAFVRETLQGAEGGHDWWHIYRVWNLCKTIAEKEPCDRFVVEIGALLHDIADAKFHDGNEELGPQVACEFLMNLGVKSHIIDHVRNIILHVSFRKRNNNSFKSIELDIIQDADRLDAMGAIGISRTFNFGGYKNREIYNPEIPAKVGMTKEHYKNSTAPTINHFYEKLLLLKDLMNTQTGKSIAKRRHQFMITYLDQFYEEWQGRS
ncbi:HD domain-containing protein [Marinilabilia rubra]|uniref:Phosphohydrolase n=1 Tax=Marinilabilia rubra TaxID=2162893 RepID=A0A2U2BB70_9BACT|nr:HD domain-containing protein [Marinilabilia rubra]PWE00283.1 phosphohydrolase [Marinilabilia rubra]